MPTTPVAGVVIAWERTESFEVTIPVTRLAELLDTPLEELPVDLEDLDLEELLTEMEDTADPHGLNAFTGCTDRPMTVTPTVIDTASA